MSITYAPDSEAEAGLPLLSSVAPTAPPFVNLLPPEIIERRALKQLGALLAAVLLLVLALAGGLVYMAGSGKGAAQAELTSAQAETARLQAQATSLDSARKAQVALQAAQTALQAAMANEVLWSRYLDELRGKLPDGVRLSNIGIAPAGSTSTTTAPAQSGTTTSGAATGSGVSANAIASITIQGRAVNQDAVASWLEALATIKGFTNTYLTTTTADPLTKVATFTVTVDVTPEALSHRFDNTGGS